MPFTFSHPAIVLPFSKIKHESVSMSGLIIGSLTPDFEYIIRMKLGGRYGHSLEGMFLLDLPIAFIAAVVFHQLVKRVLIDNSPNYIYSRLTSLRNFNFTSYLGKHYWMFLVCLLIGIASHIFWDSFTHVKAYFVENIPYLTSTISMGGLPELPAYRYLQHASTAVGAIIIIIFFHRLPSTPSVNNPSLKFWLTLILIASIAFAARASLTFEYFGDIVVTIISSAIIGLIVSSIIFLQRRAK